jgi:hypothetical protein
MEVGSVLSVSDTPSGLFYLCLKNPRYLSTSVFLEGTTVGRSWMLQFR